MKNAKCKMQKFIAQNFLTGLTQTEVAMPKT
jgi:hypothetical protein